ncbi:hypothetical protein Q095_00350 [Pseudomonas aeruginosa PS50]|uniref:hypothetical protein n=1 Tax=Pseudomonas aeruginosa TaxID=287 RepID=UPI000448EABC|nr:hypothetical protein [Pseudomonas aeruginosa]ETU79897.1 hypothetical protein Q095_00350 [Pseudomonas aeruginosa PS50]
MKSTLETVALYCHKLAYETDDQSPILRDDPIMVGYQRDDFELLVTKGDVHGIQRKVDKCLGIALKAMGGVDKPLGRELQRLSTDVYAACTVDGLESPLGLIKSYLRQVL